MTLDIYQVDAFTSRTFSGNPAAIVPLENWLDDSMLQSIAAENNLSETAYFIKNINTYSIRWFTPIQEVDLCGHATLASAHIIFEYLDPSAQEVSFHSKRGLLKVVRSIEGYVMDFPADHYQKISDPDDNIASSLNSKIKDCYKGTDDYMVVLENEQAVRKLQPDFKQLSSTVARGVIATSTGEQVDFVSRAFFPRFGIDEDPVTGSAHTLLTPYWAEKLGKTKLTALQVSNRLGELTCELSGNRVLMTGKAVTYLKGSIFI